MHHFPIFQPQHCRKGCKLSSLVTFVLNCHIIARNTLCEMVKEHLAKETSGIHLAFSSGLQQLLWLQEGAQEMLKVLV